MAIDLKTRTTIRSITDALPDGVWLKPAGIYQRMPVPRLDMPALRVELSRMSRRDELSRRGKRNGYEYRSGAKPVFDSRTLRKGTKKEPGGAMGFRELARLAETDPAAFAAHTRNDGPEWTLGLT
jgi:hypothetical protein